MGQCGKLYINHFFFFFCIYIPHLIFILLISFQYASFYLQCIMLYLIFNLIERLYNDDIYLHLYDTLY